MKKSNRRYGDILYSKRIKIFVESMNHVTQSLVCQILVLQIICTIMVVWNSFLWMLYIIPLLVMAARWKQFVFELLVIEHVIESKLGMFRWYSVVDDNLLLGAVPLRELHFDELSKLDLKAVISVVEPFELETKTLFGRPVTADDWKKANIDHIILPSTDFLPPSYSLLETGAKILDKYLVNGQRVYIHCKAGRGRSASVVLMYFYLLKRFDMKTCYKLLQSKRALIFSNDSSQMNHLLNYELNDSTRKH